MPGGEAGATRGDGDGLVRAIRAELPSMRLLTDALHRESHRRDETACLQAGLPVAVALPETTAEVAVLVRLCGLHDVPIVARGAGTGLSGAAAGIEGALTIAFTRMNRVHQEGQRFRWGPFGRALWPEPRCPDRCGAGHP